MATAELLQADPLPLVDDGCRGLRVGKSRVHLEIVIEEYERGTSAEEIVRLFDTLDLADVYAVLAYYLRHRDKVQAYLDRREEQSRLLSEEIEKRQGSSAGLREKLLQRREERRRQAGDTSPYGRAAR